jgi:hypothetical protein
LIVEQRVHVLLLYEAMPIAAPVAATAAVTSPRPQNTAPKQETILLDDPFPQRPAPARDGLEKKRV